MFILVSLSDYVLRLAGHICIHTHPTCKHNACMLNSWETFSSLSLWQIYGFDVGSRRLQRGPEGGNYLFLFNFIF